MKKILIALFVLFGLFTYNNEKVYASEIGTIVNVPENYEPILGEVENSELPSILQKPDQINAIQLKSTAPTIVTLGPFYRTFTGHAINTWGAKYLPSSQNLPAAARKAVIKRYGSVNTSYKYRIKYYNRVVNRVTSSNGSLVNVIVVNRYK